MPEGPDPQNPPGGYEDVRFRYVAPPRDECAHIRFSGRLQGKAVIWDATVLTLAYFHRRASRGDRDLAKDTILRQFIEVGKPAGIIHRLVVALDVPQIDVPTLLKTIIMVRKYKRLAIGRHEYGPVWRPR